MARLCVLTTLGVLIASSGCTPQPYTPQPYHRVKGSLSASSEVGRPTFDDAGINIAVSTACSTPITEYWCEPSRPHCQPEPITTTRETAICPADLVPGKISLRTPWGRTYPGERSEGGLHVLIDWHAVSDIGSASLRSGWSLVSEDSKSKLDYRLELIDAELRSLMTAIEGATGTDYSEAPQGQYTSVTAAVSSEVIEGEQHVVVAVTNRGPSTAYRVVVNWNVAPPLRGKKAALGRIEVGDTQKAQVPMKAIVGEKPEGAAEPTVVVTVVSANAPTVAARAPLPSKPKPAPAAPLQLACASLPARSNPGQRILIKCELTNPNDSPARGVTYQVANGANVASSGSVARLDPHGTLPFEDVVTVPDDAPEGMMKVVVTASTSGSSAVQQDVLIPIVMRYKLCSPGELTIQDYHRKHKRLDQDLAAGNISKAQLNDRLQELWSCVRPP